MNLRHRIALFVGADVIAHQILHGIVPTMCEAGFEPVIFLAQHVTSKKPEAHQTELVSFGFAERGVLSEVVYPFLAENTGASAQLALSPTQLAEKHRLHLEHVANVNDAAFEARMAKQEDFIGALSIRCYQVFKPPLIAALRGHGFVLNLHPGWLPYRRGLLSTAWAMALGDYSFGCTLHHIDEGIDTGNILSIRGGQLHRDSTVLRVNLDHMVGFAVDLLRDLVKSIQFGRSLVGQTPRAKGSYHSYPTSAELAQWKARGVVLFHEFEVPELLASRFYDQSVPGGRELGAALACRIKTALAARHVPDSVAVGFRPHGHAAT